MMMAFMFTVKCFGDGIFVRNKRRNRRYDENKKRINDETKSFQSFHPQKTLFIHRLLRLLRWKETNIRIMYLHVIVWW